MLVLRLRDAIGGVLAGGRVPALAGSLAALLTMAPPALASCFPIAAGPANIVPAAFTPASLPGAGEVRVTYLGHSSFLIETPGDATVVTDYNGVHRAAITPDIVTMNNAHSTHFTDHVESGVQHILRGWDPGGGVAMHDLRHEDLYIRNVPTNIRSFGGTRYNANSIFVFEIGDLCIAHLGHLHHTLTDVHLGELGMIDILMVPVDGSFTLRQDLMLDVIEQIAPSVVIPMHYFAQQNLQRFVASMAGRFEPLWHDTPTVTLSRLTLPYRKILVLPES